MPSSARTAATGLDFRVPSKSELAAMMRVFREQRSLNAEEAGQWLGLSKRTVEGVEQGRGFGNPRTLALAIHCLVEKKRLRDPLT